MEVALCDKDTEQLCTQPLPKNCQHTLVIEAIDTIDAGAFVVAAEQKEVLGIFDLIREQQTDCF